MWFDKLYQFISFHFDNLCSEEGCHNDSLCFWSYSSGFKQWRPKSSCPSVSINQVHFLHSFDLLSLVWVATSPMIRWLFIDCCTFIGQSTPSYISMPSPSPGKVANLCWTFYSLCLFPGGQTSTPMGASMTTSTASNVSLSGNFPIINSISFQGTKPPPHKVF